MNPCLDLLAITLPYFQPLTIPSSFLNPIILKMPSNLPAKLALTILGRLEAATSRLEDLVPTIGDSSLTADGAHTLSEQGLSGDRGMDQAGAAPRQTETLPPVIDDFDGIINEQVKSFVNMSEEIGGLVAEQVRHLQLTLEEGLGMLTPESPVCCCPSSLCCRAQVPHCHNKSQEARHSVTNLYGDFEGLAGHDGCRQ